MGKKKGGHGKWKTDNRPSAVGSDDEDLYADMEQPDPKADDYYHDAIDTFHAQRDKVLLEDDGNEDDTDKEEVLSLGDDTDEDAQISDEEDFESEDDLEPIRDIYERNVQKEEMASDIEDEEDGLPDSMAWGKKKSTYYHTDFVDEDYEGIADSAAELAELEEKEAKALQRKLAEQLSDADFGLELFQVETAEPSETTTQKVAKDLSKLSSEEKLTLLSKESPELLELVEDFKSKTIELKDTILPLLELVKQEKITSEAAVQYLNLKHQLILQYCTNVTFYLLLKAKRAPVANHPVIRRLVSFRKLLKELEPVDRKLSHEIQTVLEMISRGEEVIPLTKSAPQTTSKTKKLRVMKSIQDETAVAEENVRKDAQKRKMESKVKKKFTEAEKEILDLYSSSKKARLDEEIDSDGDEEECDDLAVEGEEDADKEEDEVGEQGDERRGINYQIKKNKGLTIKRKKEYRNPRVRHKMKFRRAKISRKGQVREARKEVQKYGGEISGIRAGLSRSIKMK